MNESSTAQTALIFLGAAIIMVPLVRKLGLSSVIGFILGGIIIGPFGLKLTGRDANDIMQATEFGVIMLLFLVGLEIEPKKFWKIRKKIIGMGLGQMAITVTLLYGRLENRSSMSRCTMFRFIFYSDRSTNFKRKKHFQNRCG